MHDLVREARVEIMEVASREVVTVIEFLSRATSEAVPRAGKSFLRKRGEILSSTANWFEIDLLRDGIPLSSKKRFLNCEYFVYSSPTELRPDGKAWPIRLEQPLPVVGIPLKSPDPDAPLELQKAVERVYDRAANDATIDYTLEPTPPLAPHLTAWVDQLPKQKKLREMTVNG